MSRKFQFFIILLLGIIQVSFAADAPAFKLTILYDNYITQPETKAEWGFAGLIEGGEKTILFDTGNSPEILTHNIKTLGIDLTRIDQIVISHTHQDHTGGLMTVLTKNPDVTVYLPNSFPMQFEQQIQQAGAKVIKVKESMEICQNVFSTGELGDVIPEQSLVMNLPQGLVVLTGCAHPGIVHITEKAKTLFRKEIYLLIGGFHLNRKSDTELKQIIDALKHLGVKYVAPTHCTGDAAISAFKQAFGEY
ncbi:MBL fold metallo-hydrolase, partial [candidate division KSB1 bacterium]|nr:MBL fold metallo-hydrolase [candidate division KSB1 bacterium]